MNNVGAPTVILAKTVKGYGLGEGGEGRNATHQQKKLTEPQIQYFHKRFDMNIPEEKVKKLEFHSTRRGFARIRVHQEARRGYGRSTACARRSSVRVQNACARDCSANRWRDQAAAPHRRHRLSSLF